MWTLFSPMRTLSPVLRLRFKGNRAWPGLPGRAQSPGVLGTPRSLPHGCLEGACQGRPGAGRPARRVGGSRAPVAQAAAWKEASWTRPTGRSPALLRGGRPFQKRGVFSTDSAAQGRGWGD